VSNTVEMICCWLIVMQTTSHIST